MSGKNVGYIRVSAADQNTARQLVDIFLDEVFEEKISGKDMSRPKLAECLKFCRKDDILHIHSIDRLARNLSDLESLVQLLTSKGVTVHFHKENLSFSGDDNSMNKLMLQMIGAVAEFERALINERRKEGVEVARQKGIKFGRPAKLTEAEILSIKKMIEEGKDKKAIAIHFGISRPTLYAVLKP